MTAKTKFYFTRKDNSDTYELSSTTACRVSESARITNRRVEDGKSLSDNYYLENRVVTFDGIITDIRNNSSVEGTEKFLNELRELRGLDIPALLDVQANNQFIPNCLIQTLDISTDPKTGVYAWKVNMVLKEVTFAERASLVEVAEPKESRKDEVSGTRDRSTNTVQEVEVSTTIGADAASTIGLLPSGIPVIPPPTDNGGT